MLCLTLVLFIVLGAETHLGGGALLFSHRPPLLEHSLQLLLAAQLSGKTKEVSDLAVVIANVHSQTHPSGKVVTTVLVFVFPLACFIMVIMGMMCVSWNNRKLATYIQAAFEFARVSAR